MNNQTASSLDRALGDLPVGQAPVDDLLLMGHAAKRRRRRAAASGAIAATVIAVGAVAVGGGALSLGPRDGSLAGASNGPSESSTPVDLPTNGWEPGDPAFEALISGTLALDEKGCVFLDHPGYGTRTYVAWPAGYTATTDPDGRVTLRAPDGAAVARTGDEVTMAGGYGPAPKDPHRCLSGSGEVAYVQSEVTRADAGQ